MRVTHWALVVTVAGAWATHYAGARWFEWHSRLGYATLVLVAFRIAWGFVGTRHARFASFLRGPRAMLDYLRGRAVRVSAGHNPLGALSVVAMLALLLLQAATGLFANDGIANAGPFYGWVSQAGSDRIASLHATNSNLLCALILLHVAAVAWHVRVTRRPILRAMLTGRKDAAEVPPAEAIAGSRTGLAVAIVLVLAAALALAIRAAPEVGVALY